MKFYSEHNEDKWIAENLRLPKKGFYLDVGAAHPTRMSNTAFLRDLGWKGIQIDADPYWIPFWKKKGFDLLSRTIFTDTTVVSLDVNKSAHRLTKVSPDKKDLMVTTTTLNNLLYTNCVEHIDFMSLDVEGLEYDIFKSLSKRYWPDILIFEYDTIGKKDHRLKKMLDKIPSFKFLHQTENNFIYYHTERIYNYHRSCWRYKYGHVGSEESHPCYFCGHNLPMKDVDKIECKVCGVMICPKCGKCLCTISDFQYMTLCRIHQKYCCRLPKYEGKIELELPYDSGLVKNYLTTIQTCFDAEKKNGNI